MDEIKRAMLGDQEAAKRLTDAGVLVMQGDCLELLKDIPDGSVDMVMERVEAMKDGNSVKR